MRSFIGFAVVIDDLTSGEGEDGERKKKKRKEKEAAEDADKPEGA